MSMFKNVNVVQYYVTDWERAKKFYTDTLQWPIAFASDEAGWFELGRDNETHIAINRWDAKQGSVPPKNGGAIAVLTVADAKKTVVELRAKGIKCDDAIEIPGMVVYGAFYDPEGNRIQFASSPSL